MVKVGRIVDQREHDGKCWSCQWTFADLFRQPPGPRIDMSLRLYEKAVEQIEQMDGPFTRAQAWHLAGGGPQLYNAFGRAIQDMRLHGLVVCVRRSVSRCNAWQVVR